MEFSFKDNISEGREAHTARICLGMVSAHRTAFCQSPGEHRYRETGAKQGMVGAVLTAAERGSCPGWGGRSTYARLGGGGRGTLMSGALLQPG